VKYPVLILAAAALLAAAPAPQSQPTPPPTPPPLIDTPAASAAPAPTLAPATTPFATASPATTLDNILTGTKASPQPGTGKHPGAHGTPPPPVPTRKGLDGVWEVEIQRGPKTSYEHMNLLQTGQVISGTYLTKDNKKYPITGSLDQQNNIRLVVSMPDGSTILLEARVDGTTDMLGMLTDAQERVPFTAGYRPKENWLENINAQPGGLGSGGPGGPL